MRAQDFSLRLRAATFLSWEFAQTLVKDKLPPAFLYDVSLNASYDGEREADETIFPDDDQRIVLDLDYKGVVAELCREDRVPEWIDISVSSVNETTTFIHLLCCGRYHGDDERLYYYEQGTQPFGIKSPVFPKGVGIKRLSGEKIRRFRLPSHEDFQAEAQARALKR